MIEKELNRHNHKHQGDPPERAAEPLAEDGSQKGKEKKGSYLSYSAQSYAAYMSAVIAPSSQKNAEEKKGKLHKGFIEQAVPHKGGPSGSPQGIEAGKPAAVIAFQKNLLLEKQEKEKKRDIKSY